MADQAAALARLDEIVRRLRRDCPWDREQDERSIVPHTVEEAYELADAAHAGDDEKMVDELADVLFQVLFLALLLEERGAGDLTAVAERLHAKLVSRHPHVFGEAEAETAADVVRNWDAIKRAESGSRLGDLPETLPATLLARKVQRRAQPAAGFLRLASSDFERHGWALFDAVDAARRDGVDAELALRWASRQFVKEIDERN